MMSPNNHSTELLTGLMELLNCCIGGVRIPFWNGACKCMRRGYAGSPYIHKGCQLGRKQIFGDHGTVLRLVAFRHHAFCPLEIVKVCTIRGWKLLIIVDKSSHSFYLYCCTVWLQKMTQRYGIPACFIVVLTCLLFYCSLIVYDNIWEVCKRRTVTQVSSRFACKLFPAVS